MDDNCCFGATGHLISPIRDSLACCAASWPQSKFATATMQPAIAVANDWRVDDTITFDGDGDDSHCCSC